MPEDDENLCGHWRYGPHVSPAPEGASCHRCGATENVRDYAPHAGHSYWCGGCWTDPYKWHTQGELRDIERRKQAEERAAERRLRSFLDRD